MSQKIRMTIHVCFVLALVSPILSLQITDLRVNYLKDPIGITSNPRFSWVLFDPSFQRGIRQLSYRIQVKNQLEPLSWDSGVVFSNQTHLVPYKGVPLTSSTKYQWTVDIVDTTGVKVTSSSSTFVTGLFSPSEWKGRWITGGAYLKNQIRKEFVLQESPTSAFVHVSGIGYFDLRCNGQKVGDHSLDVGWTNYAKRAYYVTFDLLPHLRQGANAFAITLGNGWFSCYGQQPGCHEFLPTFILQANITYQSKSLSVISDTTWHASYGPISNNSLYNGEMYNALAETPGWDLPNFPIGNWTPAALSPFKPAMLTPQEFEPIRKLSQFRSLSISAPKEGVYVVDFGQNLAGVVRININNCPAGTNITIRHAELLMHPPYGPVDGNIYTGNLRSAKATDIYTCKGDPSGVETYEPTFTQHGFRYAEVRGLPQILTEDDIVAVEMHTDVEQSGELATNQDLLNKIQHNIIWGQKSNLMSVPTDCDQRDERRGWMGDAALTCEEASFNFRMAAFYTNWLNIIRDDQNKDGSVTDYVPSLGDTSPGSPNWQTAYPTILWTVYRYYGDTDLIKNHWASLKAYFDYFDSVYIRTGLANFVTGYGDWVPPPPSPGANNHLVGAFSYLHDLTLYAELAAGIGMETQANSIRRRLEYLRQEFNAAFYVNNTYGSGLQTEIAMALWINAVQTQHLDQILDALATDIMITYNVHPTTGILGWRYLLEVLTEHSLSDVALQLNLQTTYPSIGYMIQGVGNYEPATTIWELWNSDSEGPGMNSRNHIMFGSNGAWLYKTILGIVPAPALPALGRKTGYDHVKVGPDAFIVNMVDTTSASGKVTTPHGILSVQWSVEVPPTCANAQESEIVTFTCSDGVITGFVYSYYGKPEGDCKNGWKEGKCNSANSMSAVLRACVGNITCQFEVSNNFFGGDPCYGFSKTYAGKVMCSYFSQAVYNLNLDIPIGTTADVVIPIIPSLNQTIDNLVIYEGVISQKNVMWLHQSYVPGITGITGAKVNYMQNAIVATVLSGKYSFKSVAS